MRGKVFLMGIATILGAVIYTAGFGISSSGSERGAVAYAQGVAISHLMIA